MDTLDHWIAGAPAAASTGDTLPVTDPTTGRVTHRIARGTGADVDAAVSAAEGAAPGWRRTGALARGRLFVELARAMRADAKTLAALEIGETGKPEKVALAEVENSAQYFEFYGGLTGGPAGEILDVEPDQHVYTRREPFGVVGIVNTMLMSTTERFSEFGILRTNGWSQRDVLALVTAESSLLGGLAGVLGCLLALLGTTIANQFLRNSGLQLTLTPTLFVLGLSLAVVMGTLGGLYPAWRAARLVPMEAIRLGAQ